MKSSDQIVQGKQGATLPLPSTETPTAEAEAIQGPRRLLPTSVRSTGTFPRNRGRSLRPRTIGHPGRYFHSGKKDSAIELCKRHRKLRNLRSAARHALNVDADNTTTTTNNEIIYHVVTSPRLGLVVTLTKVLWSLRKTRTCQKHLLVDPRSPLKKEEWTKTQGGTRTGKNGVSLTRPHVTMREDARASTNTTIVAQEDWL